MADTYAYKVRDRSGKMVSGTLVADSQELVLGRLRDMGYTPLGVGVRRAGMKREISFGGKGKLKDLALFSRQFATMVNSGLPILRALAILETQTESSKLSKAVGDMRLD